MYYQYKQNFDFLSMEDKSIIFFLDLCRLKTFKEVAEKHNVSTSSVTRIIKDLEEKYSTLFFRRSTKGISLTEEGEIFKRLAVQIEKIHNQAEYIFNEKTIIKINTTSNVFAAAIKSILKTFISEFNLGIYTTNALEHSCDLYIGPSLYQDGFDIDICQIDIEFSLCASKNYFKANNLPIPKTKRDLLDHSLILFESSIGGLSKTSLEFYLDDCRKTKKWIATDSPMDEIAMVEEGLGIAVIAKIHQSNKDLIFFEVEDMEKIISPIFLKSNRLSYVGEKKQAIDDITRLILSQIGLLNKEN